MERIHEYMVGSPLPCVYFVISEKEQAKIFTQLAAINQNRSASKGEKLHLKLVDKNNLAEASNNHPNWFDKVNHEPTCVVYFTDWQKYKVESSKSLSADLVSEPNLVDMLSASVGVPVNVKEEKKKKDKDKHHKHDSDEPYLCKVASKTLERMIREDIDNFLTQFKTVYPPKTVPHKYLFMVTLNKNIKNPNKVIGSLKSLDPAEVCAVCVSCGMSDLNSKLEKVEQMMYETSAAYYEKKVKKLTKATANQKSQTVYASSDAELERAELNQVRLNFKLAYFSEFLPNRKEAHAKYAACLGALKQMNTGTNIVDKASLAFFTSLRIIEHLFASGDATGALGAYKECKEYLERLVMMRHTGLYHNIMHVLDRYMGHKMEQEADSEKGPQMLQQAVSYYKWALYHMTEMLKHFKKLSNELGTGETCVVHHDVHNTYFYEDPDYANIHRPEDEATDCLSEYEIVKRWRDAGRADLADQESQATNAVKGPDELEELEREVMRLVATTTRLCKQLKYFNNLTYVYSLLGDLRFMRGSYSEAVQIHIRVFQFFTASIDPKKDHQYVGLNVPRKEENKQEDERTRIFNYVYKLIDEHNGPNDGETSEEAEQEPEELDYVDLMKAMLYADMTVNKSYVALFAKLLAKVIVALVHALNLHREAEPPEMLYELADAVRNDGEAHELAEAGTYTLILIKSLLTMILVTNSGHNLGTHEDERALIAYLDSVIAMYNRTSEPGESYLLINDDKSRTTYAGNRRIELNFEVNLNLSLTMTRGMLLTSEGALFFHHTRTEDGVVYCGNGYTEQESSGEPIGDRETKMVIEMTDEYELQNVKIYAIVLNVRYMDDFVINAILIPGGNYQQYRREEALKNKQFKTPANTRKWHIKHVLNNLIYALINTNVPLSSLNAEKAMRRNVRAKLFIKDVINNYSSPFVMAVVYNGRLDHIYRQHKYTLKVDCKNTYVYGKNSRDGNSYTLSKTSEVALDFNDCLTFSGEEGREGAPAVEIKLDSSGQPKYVMYRYSRDSRCEVDEEVLKYLRLFDNEHTRIFLIYGLMSLTNEVNMVKYSLCRAPADGDSADADAERAATDQELTLFADTLDLTSGAVNENIINFNVSYKFYANNEKLLLYINLINNNNIAYGLLGVNVLHNNVMLSKCTHHPSDGDTKLHGYSNVINPFENLSFIYVIEKEILAGSNIIQVQVVKYVKRKLYYPFINMKHFLKYTINKYISIDNSGNTGIKLALEHSKIVTLGKPFSMKCNIANTTNATMEYAVTLAEEDKAFIVAGPLQRNLIAPPNSSETLEWNLIPTKCSTAKLPVVHVVNRMDPAGKTQAKTIAAQVYVTQQQQPPVEN